MEDNNKQVLTTGEVAKYCGVSMKTVIRWIQRGELKAFQLPGRGDNRVLWNDFVEFLDKNKMNIAKDPDKIVPRVLIVDDDESMARSIQRTLIQHGIETQIADSGFQAGMLLGSFAPHVMTLDLKMPGLSGQGVLKLLRASQRFQDIKILLISGSTQEELDQAMAMGGDDSLIKPFQGQTLIEKITLLLAEMGFTAPLQDEDGQSAAT